MDLRQIKEISESESGTYWCPEPVLLNVGGCAAGAWPQGSPKTGHTGSPSIRPYGRHGLWSQAGLWKSRQPGCLGNRSAIPTFPQPQQQHHLICGPVERKTTVLYAPESNKRL